MEISSANNNSVAGFTAKGAALGAAIGGGYTAVKTLKPTAKDAFVASIRKQAEVLDKIEKSGKTHEQFFEDIASKIKNVTAKNVGATWYDKYQNAPEVLEKYCQNVDAKISQGTGNILKNYEKLEAATKGGKTSNFAATQDAGEAVFKKISEKAWGIRNKALNVKNNFAQKETLKEQVEYIKKGLGNNKKTLAKYGKAAIIGAAALGASAFILKAVSNKVAEKKEN